MIFSEAPEFKKDVKLLARKVRTLQSDLKPLPALIEPLYVPVKDVDITQYRSLFFDGKRATILEKTDMYEVIKIRVDTASHTMHGKLRLVFVAMIHEDRVMLLELFAKNVKSREDVRRIQKYTKPLQ